MAKKIFFPKEGDKNNRFTTIKFLHRDNRGAEVWLFKCDCGNYREKNPWYVYSGKTKSCGCLALEIRKTTRRKTHGMSKTRIYHIWKGMRQRCNNPNTSYYYVYGGKGIKICDEWQSFENFYEWSMKNGYDDKLSIDRIDNDKDYSPDNCRWSTGLQQANNKSINHYETYNGETHTIAEWARLYDINLGTLSSRLQTGMSIENALKMKKHEKKHCLH